MRHCCLSRHDRSPQAGKKVKSRGIWETASDEGRYVVAWEAVDMFWGGSYWTGPDKEKRHRRVCGVSRLGFSSLGRDWLQSLSWCKAPEHELWSLGCKLRLGVRRQLLRVPDNYIQLTGTRHLHTTSANLPITLRPSHHSCRPRL
jgi:hypothetical protein